jgi:tellurite resistance protein TerC
MIHWGAFLILIILLLALDLGVFNRRDHVIKVREALLWTGFWIFLSLVFNVFVYFAYSHNWFDIGLGEHHVTSGSDAALKFFTGYIIEKSLSLDNIFVIALIFSYFRVPLQYQHRVLFLGILGALVMRAGMILAGVVLVERFTWMIYVFGSFLIFTAIRMLTTRMDDFDPDKNWLIRMAKRIYPVAPHYDGHKFFTRINGRRAITPMLLVLLVIESSDVLFAIDSIPAIFAVTTDPFIIFTSNVFAILGLRSLYFALAALLDKFRYLKLSLVFVLAYVGVKMLLSHTYPIPTPVSLGIIAGILIVGISASVIVSRKQKSGK